GTFKIIDTNFDIPNLFQKMESLARQYYGLDPPDERIEYNKRLYRFCQIGPIPETIPPKLPIRFAINMCQFDSIMSWDKILQKSTELLKKLYDLKEILPQHVRECETTLKQAKYWIEHHAPEKAKIKITDELPRVSFTDEQKAGIKKLIEILPEKEWNEQELQNKIFEIGKNIVGNQKKFFQALYQALIGKNFGPRLAPFLLSLDLEWTISRLKRVL
ncbi:MAG: hypothetical protein ACXQS8_09010, partial [Candidatus Helarchaeales archaeon]